MEKCAFCQAMRRPSKELTAEKKTATFIENKGETCPRPELLATNSLSQAKDSSWEK